MSRTVQSNALSILIFLVTILVAAPLSAADAESEPLTVGFHRSPPFVMVDGDRIYGLAVDIWERIAARNQIPFKFKRYNTVKALLKATEDGDIDLAVTNLTITNKRAKRVDFTQPWFEGGTRLLVRQHDDTGFMAIIKGMYEQGYLKVYAFLGGVILIATLLFTLFDRRFDPAFPKRWRDGAAESFYTVMQVVTSGHPPSRKNLFGWLGRIWQGI